MNKKKLKQLIEQERDERIDERMEKERGILETDLSLSDVTFWKKLKLSNFMREYDPTLIDYQLYMAELQEEIEERVKRKEVIP